MQLAVRASAVQASGMASLSTRKPVVGTFGRVPVYGGGKSSDSRCCARWSQRADAAVAEPGLDGFPDRGVSLTHFGFHLAAGGGPDWGAAGGECGADLIAQAGREFRQGLVDADWVDAEVVERWEQE